VKYEIGDRLVDSHNILNRWRNYFSRLLNVHNVSGVRQIELNTTEPLVPSPSRLEMEIVIAKLKSVNHQVVIQFQQYCYKQEAKYYCQSPTNSTILFGERKNCLISGRSWLLYQFIKRVKN
jgi:hypothetical protein